MRERATKISSINICTFFLWNIHIFTSWAIDLFKKFIFCFPFKNQNTLTLEVLSSSDIPIGRTACLSQRTLGQTPNFPSKNFSLMMAKPNSLIQQVFKCPKIYPWVKG